MTDEEYLFRQTERERKQLGYGDKHKKRGGGRYVRLPSDNLTRKEREALNGEVKVYKKKEFYTWEEFVKLPSDLQVAWVNSLINRFGCGMDTISTVVLGKSEKALRLHLARNGEVGFINKGVTGRGSIAAKKSLVAAFENWKNTQVTMCEEDLPQDDPDPAEIEENQPKIEALPESPAPEAEEAVTPAPQITLKQGDLSNIGVLIQSLIGSGAKLTIEVTL